MKLCILISAFCLLTSVGLGHDVGVDRILSPSGNVDSGQSITPWCIVANYGDSTADLWAHLVIDDGGRFVYADSLWLGGLVPSRRETVSFHTWLPQGRDSAIAIAWTVCDRDTYPLNDTLRQRFFQRIKDLGLSDLWPSGDTFDSGQVIVPHVRASNLGNVTLSFWLWRDSITLPSGEDTVVYGDSIVCMPGIWAVQASVVIAGDLHPGNNLIVDTFYVRSGSAIEENAVHGSWPSHDGKLQPTVLRRLSAGAVAFDATGRRALNPKPGVYFVMEQTAISSQYSGTENGARSTVHVRKVVVGR